jgi:hypothetical protein
MTGRIWVDAIDQRGDSKAFKKEFDTEEEYDSWVDSWVEWGGKIVGVRDINSHMYDRSDVVRRFIDTDIHVVNWWTSQHYVMKLVEKAVGEYGVSLTIGHGLVNVSGRKGGRKLSMKNGPLPEVIAQTMLEYMEAFEGFNQ